LIGGETVTTGWKFSIDGATGSTGTIKVYGTVYGTNWAGISTAVVSGKT